MDRLLVAVDGTIGITLFGPDGEPEDASGDVDVVIVDGDGDQVHSGVADDVVGETGRYTLDVPADVLDELDVFTATWTLQSASEFTTRFETVGGFLFSLQRLRGHAEELEDTDKYPAGRLIAERTYAEQRLEELCEVAFVPRSGRATLDGDGSDTVILPDVEIRRLVAATVDGVDVDISTLLAHRSGIVVRRGEVFPRGYGNVTVRYEHGLDQPPEPVRRAGVLLAADKLFPLALAARATSVTSDAGTYRLHMEGRDGPTGIPEVDAVIGQFGRQRPGVG